MARTGVIPEDLDPGDLERLGELYRSLLNRHLSSREELERWLEDVSELEKVVDEFGSKRYIGHTCHTDDEAIEADYLHFVEAIEPEVKRWRFALQRRLIESPYVEELDGRRYEVFIRGWRNAVDLFREENVPLEVEESKLFTEYGKITGAMTVDYDGESRTLQQMAKHLEEPDRGVREEAWRHITERRLRDGAAMDELFAKLLELRQEIAENAGFKDYREYVFRQRERFDYTAEDCLRFGDAIAEHCLPLVEGLDWERKKELGVSQLRPWDLSVDVRGRPPLRPFRGDEIPLFVERTREVFARISEDLGEMFGQLEVGRNLDLESRKGKRPGGYQASLEVSRQPFIFMNAVGTQRDVETLLHEGGHAFHYLEAAQEPLVFLRHAPLEFCEVASMSMELLGSGFLDVFYPSRDDAIRARRGLLEGIVRFLPWMATVDGFQHWLYTHGGHSPEERREAWLSIQKRFSSSVVDWAGLEDSLPWRWQAQIHIFGMPFYYIEYGIAQLGALQVWLRFRRDPAEALSSLRRAFALGAKPPLPELFETAGVRFDLTAGALAPLMREVEQELVRLKEA